MSLSKLSHQPTMVVAENGEFERANGDSTKESKLFFFFFFFLRLYIADTHMNPHRFYQLAHGMYWSKPIEIQVLTGEVNTFSNP